MSLGAFLKSERKLRNLTQENVANAVGVVVPVVSKWENDKSVPDLSALCVICNLLDLSVEEVSLQHRYVDGRKRTLPPEVYDSVAVGKTLRELRIKNGLSQNDAGQKLYVTSQTVSKWEGGAVMLLETLLKLSEFYCVSPSELICGLNVSETVTAGNAQNKSTTDESSCSDATRQDGAADKSSAATSKILLIRIIGIILAIAIAVASVVGIYVRKHNKKLRGELPAIGGSGDGDGTGSPDDGSTGSEDNKKPDNPVKEFCKLTINTPRREY